MFYTTDANDHGFPHDPFKAIVTPRPIGWIGSIDKDGMSRGADYELLKIVKEHCNVPFIYGGGIQDNVEIEKLFKVDVRLI